MNYNTAMILELNEAEIGSVDGAAIPLLLIAFGQGFVAGAGTVAAGGAILDAAGIVDLW